MGKNWKTLDDVDLVIVAAVDSVSESQNVEVYVLPAAEVRKCFVKAYAARKKNGQAQKDNFGMWVGLDHDTRGIAASVESGIVDTHKPVAVYPIASLRAKIVNETKSQDGQDDEEVLAGKRASATRQEPPSLSTISEVLGWARERVASIAGVEVSAVKLELRMSSDA